MPCCGETLPVNFCHGPGLPDKRIASVKPKSVIKRVKEKQFAASVNRNTIME
jgi:hypothetical protein